MNLCINVDFSFELLADDFHAIEGFEGFTTIYVFQGNGFRLIRRFAKIESAQDEECPNCDSG